MKLRTVNKRGQANPLASLPGTALTFVLAIIVLGIGAQISGETRDSMTTNSLEWNITNKSMQGLEKLSTWMPTTGLVIGAGLVITVLLISFTATGRM